MVKSKALVKVGKIQQRILLIRGEKVIIDADLAAPLGTFLDFLEFFEKRPDIDIVFGSRVRLLGRTIERNFIRHILGRLFATIVSLVTHVPVYDTQCGVKLFRAKTEIVDLFKQLCDFISFE